MLVFSGFCQFNWWNCAAIASSICFSKLLGFDVFLLSIGLIFFQCRPGENKLLFFGFRHDLFKNKPAHLKGMRRLQFAGCFCCSTHFSFLVHTVKPPPPSPRRPQTSISVFPRELAPGTRGQSVASCQPRNVTSPPTCTQTCLLAPPLSMVFHQLPKREKCMREMRASIRVCVCKCGFCVWISLCTWWRL